MAPRAQQQQQQAVRGKGTCGLTLDVPVGARVLRERLEDRCAPVLIRPAEPNDAVHIIEVGTVAVGDHP